MEGEAVFCHSIFDIFLSNLGDEDVEFVLTKNVLY